MYEIIVSIRCLMNPSDENELEQGCLGLGLSDRLVGDLIEEIVSGVFPPGAMLPSENDLAERAGVSRLTMREAIKVLRTKHVLEVKHGRGTIVSPISSWSPFDPALLAARSGRSMGVGALPKKLIEARRIVEVGVAELAAARRSGDDLESMRVALERMKTSDDDVDAFAEADIGFHQAVMTAAGNAFIAALFDPIEQLVWEGRRQTKAYAGMRERAIVAHARILKAVHNKDPEAARWAMYDHLVQTEEDLDAYLARENAGEDGQREPSEEGLGAIVGNTVGKKVAMLHTSFVFVNVEPSVVELFEEIVPEAEVIHFVDSDVLATVMREGSISEASTSRMVHLAKAAEEAGADVIFNACSSLGPTMDAAQEAVGIPIVRIDDGMARKAAEAAESIGVLATVATTLDPTAALIERKAAGLDKQVRIVRKLSEGAFETLMAGGRDEHDRMVLESARELAPEVEVIVLAQASMSRLAPALAAETGLEVLSSPRLGVEYVRQTLGAS